MEHAYALAPELDNLLTKTINFINKLKEKHN